MRYRLPGRSGLRVSELAADESGCTPAQVAIAWVRQQGDVMIPLVGVRNADRLADNLGALEVTLDAVQLERLDDVSAIELGFPHDFPGPEGSANEFVHGETANVLDAHRGELAR